MPEDNIVIITTEKIIHTNRKTDCKTLRKEHLDTKKVICKNFDRTISFKVVDDDGNIYMLVEAVHSVINEQNLVNEHHGCFISRFIADEYFMKTTKFRQCISEFVESVKYAMTDAETKTETGKKYKMRYQYIWARKLKGDYCHIAGQLDMPLFDEDSSFQTYKLEIETDRLILSFKKIE